MRLVPVSFLLFTALSCSDPAAPEYDGALSFAYTGAGGGSFSASGPAPSFNAPPPTSTSWAVGYTESGEAYVLRTTTRVATALTPYGVIADLARELATLIAQRYTAKK